MSKPTSPGLRWQAVCGRALCFAIAALSPAQAQVQAEPGVDVRVRPGDDFYAYANGEWLANTTLPTGQGRWTARNQIDELTRQRIAALMTEAAAAPAGSDARKLADFEAAYRDEAAIEARGLGPAKPLLGRIAALDSKAALVRHLGRTLRADVDPLGWGVYSSPNLFGLAVQRGIHGEAGHFAYLLQGGLGLPGREAYLADTEAAQQRRLKYRDHIGRLLAHAGFQPALRRADAVLALETAIARGHADEAASSNERNADHRWTRADFKARAPGMAWDLYFDAAGLARQPVVVAWQPGAITHQAALVASEPLAVWKDYLSFHLLHQHAAVLPRTLDEAALAPRTTEPAALALPEVLGRLYAERHFPPALKQRVQTITANVKAALARRVESTAWMSPAMRTMAQAKLKAVYFGLGYPEKWTDTHGLHIDARDAFGNQQRLAAWNTRRALARLGQPVDPTTQWLMAPHTVGAVFLPLDNAYNFTAALLQAPKFDPEASDATNYGAIGAIVGHELSHFIDTLGADYDASGALNTWWTPADRARYDAAAAALARQYADYHPLPGMAVDGTRTLGENVADLGGLAAAFDAYRATLGSQVSDQAQVRQHDRQFFIGYARSWRSLYTDDALRKQLAQDNHAPDRHRVATVRNLDAWYEAFDVQPGQALYLPPAARVRVW